MATLELFAEIGGDGGCLLFTHDPPGLLARGATREEALAAAPGEAARLRRLLAGDGLLGLLREPWGDAETPVLRVVETEVGRHRVTDGGTKVTFERDHVPVRRDEVAGFLALMALVRGGVMALGDRLPPEAYAFRSKPHRMTIGEQLRHMATCDYWYYTRLWKNPPHLPRTDNVWDKLTMNRRRVLDRLENLTDSELALDQQTDRQVWTTRKLFRRYLYHDRFHWDTIERDLALLLTT